MGVDLAAGGEPGCPRQVPIVRAGPADIETLGLVSTLGYMDAVRRASRPGFLFCVGHGLGTPDNPIFPSMHGGRSADRRGSVAGARAIADGEVDRAVNFHTSLRHAMANHASGFCFHNENEAAQTHRRGAAGRGAQGRPRRRRREPRLADPVLRRPRGTERVHPPEPVVTVPSVHAGGNRIGVLFAVLQLAKLSIIGGHSTSTSSPALCELALPTAGIVIAIRGYRFAQVGRVEWVSRTPVCAGPQQPRINICRVVNL